MVQDLKEAFKPKDRTNEGIYVPDLVDTVEVGTESEPYSVPTDSIPTEWITPSSVTNQ